MGDVTLRCFNTKGEYGDRKFSDIISSDSVTLQFPSGMKVSHNLQFFIFAPTKANKKQHTNVTLCSLRGGGGGWWILRITTLQQPV